MKTTIQKAREWAILLTGMALMAFSIYAFYSELRNEIDKWILIGGFMLGVLLLAQPTRLNEVFDLVFSKLKSDKNTTKRGFKSDTIDPTIKPPEDGGDPPKL